MPRALLALGVLLGLAGSVQAQTVLPDEAGAAALQCLQRRAAPPKFPLRDLAVSRFGNLDAPIKSDNLVPTIPTV